MKPAASISISNRVALVALAKIEQQVGIRMAVTATLPSRAHNPVAGWMKFHFTAAVCTFDNKLYTITQTIEHQFEFFLRFPVVPLPHSDF